jgi:hypothetical protein
VNCHPHTNTSCAVTDHVRAARSLSKRHAFGAEGDGERVLRKSKAPGRVLGTSGIGVRRLKPPHPF